MPFDPDAFVAQPSPSPSKGFDPDAFIGESPKESWLDKKVLGGTPRGYIKGGLNLLPTTGAYVGGIGGGAAGVEAGPVGMLAGGTAGAALGGAAGEHLKNLGEQYILGEDKKPGDYVSADAQGMLHGATQEVGGQVASKALGMVRSAPSSLKDYASAPPVAETSEKVVYDPMMKTYRKLGASVDELADLGRPIDTGGVAEKSLGQKAAGVASSALDKTADAAKTTAKVAGKVIPIAAKVGGGFFHGLPGYAAAEALTSEPVRDAVKSGVSAADEFVSDPHGMGLLLEQIRQAKEKSKVRSGGN